MFGAGTKNAAAGVSNAAHVVFFDALGNEFLDVTGYSVSDIFLVFSATPGAEANAPNASSLAAITQTTKYHGDGVYTVYYAPPATGATGAVTSYYLRITAFVGGVSVPGSASDVLVAPATSANAFTTAVLDDRLHQLDVSVPVNGNRFVAGVAGYLKIEVRDSAGAATGAPSADYARITCVPSKNITTGLTMTSEGRVGFEFTAIHAGLYACLLEAGGPSDANYVAIGGNWGKYFPITTFRLPDCPYKTDIYSFTTR